MGNPSNKEHIKAADNFFEGNIFMIPKSLGDLDVERNEIAHKTDSNIIF